MSVRSAIHPARLKVRGARGEEGTHTGQSQSTGACSVPWGARGIGARRHPRRSSPSLPGRGTAPWSVLYRYQVYTVRTRIDIYLIFAILQYCSNISPEFLLPTKPISGMINSHTSTDTGTGRNVPIWVGVPKGVITATRYHAILPYIIPVLEYRYTCTQSTPV